MTGKGPVPLSIEKVYHLSRSFQPLTGELGRWLSSNRPNGGPPPERDNVAKHDKNTVGDWDSLQRH